MKRQTSKICVLGALLWQVMGGPSHAFLSIHPHAVRDEVVRSTQSVPGGVGRCEYTEGSMNSYNGPWMWVSEKFLRAVEKHTSDYVRAAVDPSPCPRTWIGSRISAALQECKKTSKSCKNIYKFIKSSQIGESGTLTFADELTVVLSVLVEGALKESAMDGACGEEGEQECPDQLYTAMLHDLMPNGYVIKRDGLLLLYKITVSDLLRSDP